ncbi:MAG: hypothetical protein LBV61_02875 [Burkholderiaceae bacterium]|nr:hypothetical protein [Burkholderiaceae bacterium]
MRLVQARLEKLPPEPHPQGIKMLAQRGISPHGLQQTNSGFYLKRIYYVFRKPWHSLSIATY